MQESPISIGALRARFSDALLASVLAECKFVDEFSLLQQLSLHLPRFETERALYNEATLIDEAYRLAGDLEARRSEHASFLDPEPIELKEVEFRPVPEQFAAYPILEDFHYIRSFRPESHHFGLYRNGSDENKIWPIAMASISPFDLNNVDLENSDVTFDIKAKALVLSRVYAFPNSPKNSLSYLFGKIRSWIKVEFPETNYLVTYVNPNMGFTGVSYRADNWHLLGEEHGIRYHYLGNKYKTLRFLWEFCGRDPFYPSNDLGIRRSRLKLLPLLLFIRGINNPGFEYQPGKFRSWSPESDDGKPDHAQASTPEKKAA